MSGLFLQQIYSLKQFEFHLNQWNNGSVEGKQSLELLFWYKSRRRSSEHHHCCNCRNSLKSSFVIKCICWRGRRLLQKCFFFFKCSRNVSLSKSLRSGFNSDQVEKRSKPNLYQVIFRFNCWSAAETETVTSNIQEELVTDRTGWEGGSIQKTGGRRQEVMSWYNQALFTGVSEILKSNIWCLCCSAPCIHPFVHQSVPLSLSPS